MTKTFTKTKLKSTLSPITENLEFTFDKNQFYDGIKLKMNGLVKQVSNETIKTILAYSAQKKSL